MFAFRYGAEPDDMTCWNASLPTALELSVHAYYITSDVGFFLKVMNHVADGFAIDVGCGRIVASEKGNDILHQPWLLCTDSLDHALIDGNKNVFNTVMIFPFGIVLFEFGHIAYVPDMIADSRSV